AYLFPNGGNTNDNSDQRRLLDSTNEYYAVPPIPAFAWARSPDFNPSYFNPATTYKPWPNGGGLTFANAITTATRWDAVYSTSGKTIDLTRDFGGNASTDTTNPCTDSSLPGMSSNYYFRVFHGMTLPQGTCFFASSSTSNVGSKDQHWQVARSGG